MSRNESDYQSNQRPGLRTTHEQLYSNFEIARPFSEYHKQGLGIVNLEEKRKIEVKDDKAGEGLAPSNLDVAYYNCGYSENDIKNYKQQLQNAQNAQKKTDERLAYAKLGCAYCYLGNLEEAIANHCEELKIAIELKEQAAEESACVNLGIAYHKAGRYYDAIEVYEISVKIAEKLNNKVDKGLVLCHLGNVYDSLGDYKNAIDSCKKALKIAEEINDHLGNALANGNLGNAYAAYLGALANGNLGNAYAHLGDFKQAEIYHRAQLTLGTEHRDKYIQVRANCYLGNDYCNIPGRFAKGIKYAKKGLEIAKEEKDRPGEMLANKVLGSAYLRLADFGEAEKYHSEHLKIAQEIWDRKEQGRAYVNLGDVYRGLNDFQRAEVFHKQGLAVSKDVEDKIGQGRALYSLGRDCESVGSLSEALEYHRSSLKLYNEVRKDQSEDASKIHFRDQHKNAYTALWQSLIKHQLTDEALYEAEKGRAQGLSDLLKLHYSCKVSKGSKETFLVKVPFGGPGEISHIVRNIPTQTVFIALESNKINFWVIRKGDEIHFRRKEMDVANTFQHLNNNAYTAIEAHSSDGNNKVAALRNLYDAIIGPIEDLLDFKGEELIIIPDGPLYFVPYAALINHEEPAAKYLGDCIRVRIFPSLISLKFIVDDEGHHSTTGSLLVGDPRNSLPHAETEVQEIAKIIGTPDDHLLTKQKATKTAVKDKIKTVALVHIATHGKADGSIELALESAYDDDSDLTMKDVQDGVGLTARLVVLSSCESARGTVSAEGVIGIARAFLSAGARSVLVSLWKIDDESTMHFMTNFYKNLKSGKRASEALQLAMKDLRDSLQTDIQKKKNAEKYWAPFVLIDDDVTLTFGESK